MNLQDKIREILEPLKDEKFKVFSKKLIFQPEILGVKTPELKKIAKALNPSVSEIRNFEPIFHEEFSLKSFFILNLKDDEIKFDLASEFVKTMPNWAVCDQFGGLKFKDAKFINLLLKQCLNSNLEYEKRFFYVYFMRNSDALPLERFFEICMNEKDDRYYVKMATAWAIAEIFLKFQDEVLTLFKAKKLDKFVQNKTISKIKDSRRITKELKDELLKFKIV